MSERRWNKCANCAKAIFQDDFHGPNDWYHDGSGMYRCDGKSYDQRGYMSDDRDTEWAQPASGKSTVEIGYDRSVQVDDKTVDGPVEPRTPEAQLLLDAIKTINGERQDQYGNAEDSFAVIADYWQAYLCQRNPDEAVVVTAKDVAMMMVLFKLAREGNSPKRDNLLDAAGYLGLGHRIEAKNG